MSSALSNSRDAVLSGESKQFGRWSARLLFAPLPFADYPGGDIQVGRKNCLTDGRLCPDAANRRRRKFHDWRKTCAIEFTHGLAVDSAYLVQVRHAFVQCRERFALVRFCHAPLPSLMAQFQ